MVQGNQDVGVMLATLWCHWKRLSVLPLLVGVMYLFGHQVTGDLPGHSTECQRFKMDGVYVGVLQEVFGIVLIAPLLFRSPFLHC